MVAFEAETLGGSVKGVYHTTDGSTVTPVAVTSPGGLIAVDALGINDNGTVTFYTQTTTGTESLNLDSDGTPTVFANDTGETFDSFGPAAVAESGATAFRGIFKLGLNAIFAGGTGSTKGDCARRRLLGSGVTRSIRARKPCATRPFRLPRRRG